MRGDGVPVRPAPLPERGRSARRIAMLETRHVAPGGETGGDMVKTLVLVRHGDPEAGAPSGSDLDRRLTPAGARALRVSYPRTFALLGDDPALQVWSSPAVRALETADVVAAVTGADDIEVHQSLYAQDAPAFLAELAASDAPCVVAVGHAPFMDTLAARLLGACPTFDKGTAAAIELTDDERGRLLWFVAGPRTSSWRELALVERAVADAAEGLGRRCKAFLHDADDPDVLLDYRAVLRRVRSLVQFLAPWQSKKQARRCLHVLKDQLALTARLRELDILAECVDGLVESGELGENSPLPSACAKERELERASVIERMRKGHARKELAHVVDDLTRLRWKSRVIEGGLTVDDLRARFDAQFDEVDEALFGLDLHDGDTVYVARRDAREMRYVAELLGEVLGEERAQSSGALDEVQRELRALSDARSIRRLADECAKSPRFRGARADLGVVARDQAEVVSAVTSGMERRELEDDELEASEKDAADAGADAPAEAPEPAEEA